MKSLIALIIFIIIFIMYIKDNIITFDSGRKLIPKFTRISPTLWTVTWRKWLYYSNTEEMVEIIEGLNKKLRQIEINKLDGTKK